MNHIGGKNSPSKGSIFFLFYTFCGTSTGQLLLGRGCFFDSVAWEVDSYKTIYQLKASCSEGDEWKFRPSNQIARPYAREKKIMQRSESISKAEFHMLSKRTSLIKTIWWTNQQNCRPEDPEESGKAWMTLYTKYCEIVLESPSGIKVRC